MGRRADRHGGDAMSLADLVGRIAWTAEALAAVSAALQLHGSSCRAAPAVERALAEVLDALGLTEVLHELEQADVVALSDVVCARMRHACELSSDPLRAPGWRPTRRDALLSASVGAPDVARLVCSDVVPRLEDLSDRLASPRAAFLATGASAGGLVIALCELYPRLYGTAIDVWAPALAVARERVARARLGERVCVRCEDVAELDEHDAYDLAWLAADHVGPQDLAVAARRVLRATRPGGWIVLNGHGGPDELRDALARLRTARDGGTLLRPDEAEALLVDAGWCEVASLPPGLLPAIRMTAGRRDAKAQRGSRARRAPALRYWRTTTRGQGQPKEES